MVEKAFLNVGGLNTCYELQLVCSEVAGEWFNVVQKEEGSLTSALRWWLVFCMKLVPSTSQRGDAMVE